MHFNEVEKMWNDLEKIFLSFITSISDATSTSADSFFPVLYRWNQVKCNGQDQTQTDIKMGMF